MLGAPTSLASIMVIARSAPPTPPSHTSEIAPKWASGSTWFGKGSQGSAGLSFCVLVTISPRRANLGGLSRGMQLADTPPRRPPPLAHRRRARDRSPNGYIHMLTTWDLFPKEIP